MIKVELTKQDTPSKGYVVAGDSLTIPFYSLPEVGIPRPTKVELKFTKSKPKKGDSICFTRVRGLILTEGKSRLLPALLHRIINRAFQDHSADKTHMQITPISYD